MRKLLPLIALFLLTLAACSQADASTSRAKEEEIARRIGALEAQGADFFEGSRHDKLCASFPVPDGQRVYCSNVREEAVAWAEGYLQVIRAKKPPPARAAPCREARGGPLSLPSIEGALPPLPHPALHSG